MLAGNMGLANAERSLYYIRVITEFISQPEYRDVIPIFGIVNEVRLVSHRYLLASKILRARPWWALLA